MIEYEWTHAFMKDGEIRTKQGGLSAESIGYAKQSLWDFLGFIGNAHYGWVYDGEIHFNRSSFYEYVTLKESK